MPVGTVPQIREPRLLAGTNKQEWGSVMGTDQHDAVVQSLTTEPGHRPVRNYARHDYLIEGPGIRPDRVPVVDAVIETKAGAYWRVVRVSLHYGEAKALLSAMLTLEPLKPHSVEVHNALTVQSLQGGKLL